MNILVTGASGPAGRSLLTQLHRRGLSVLGVDMAPQPRTDGLPVTAVPAASDPEYVAELRRLVQHHEIDLLLPTVQEELPILARHRLAQTLVADPEPIDIAGDKWTTHQVLQAAGIAVPRTALGSRLTPAAAEWIGAPFVTKPRVSRGGRGVVVHQASTPHPDKMLLDETLIVSEFVPGQEYCPNVFVADDPSDDIAVVLRKTGLAGGNIGNATGVEISTEAHLGDLALAACRAIGLRGPCDVDVRLRADGTPVVLEINARFGANSAAAPALLDAALATLTTGASR